MNPPITASRSRSFTSLHRQVRDAALSGARREAAH